MSWKPPSSLILACFLLCECFLHAHPSSNIKPLPDSSESNFKCRLTSSDKFRIGSQAHEIVGYNWIRATRSSAPSATILSFQNDSLYMYPQLLPTQSCNSSHASDCYCLFRVHQSLYVPLEHSPPGAHIL